MQGKMLLPKTSAGPSWYVRVISGEVFSNRPGYCGSHLDRNGLFKRI